MNEVTFVLPDWFLGAMVVAFLVIVPTSLFRDWLSWKKSRLDHETAKLDLDVQYSQREILYEVGILSTKAVNRCDAKPTQENCND